MVSARSHLILVIVVISPVVSVTVIDLARTDTVDVRKTGNETVIVTALEMAVVVIKIGSRIDGIVTGTRSEIAVKTEIESESGIVNVIEEENGNAIVVVNVVVIVKERASVVATDQNLPTPTPTLTIAPPSLKLAASKPTGKSAPATNHKLKQRNRNRKKTPTLLNGKPATANASCVNSRIEAASSRAPPNLATAATVVRNALLVAGASITNTRTSSR
jgi:hypothetical protein